MNALTCREKELVTGGFGLIIVPEYPEPGEPEIAPQYPIICPPIEDLPILCRRTERA